MIGIVPTKPNHHPKHQQQWQQQGDGHARVKIDETVLTEWFGQLDHLMPHARVALADLTCLDDGGWVGEDGRVGGW